MINRQMVDSVEALCLDCLDCGVPKSNVIEQIIKLGQRCMELELYEFMPEVHRIYNEIEKVMKKPGTYIFNTWGEASDFCQENGLPIDDIETVYRTYRVTISKT